MIWAGSPLAQLIEFGTGFPVGAISYQLLANDGATVIVSDDITPLAGAVSALIVIPGDHHAVATPLFETRTLVWHFQTETGLVSDRKTYRVNRPLPFPASYDGVRSKLGVAAHELPEADVDLVSAYAELRELAPAIDQSANTGDRNNLLVTAAIEAQAALAALPTLQLRAARSETSGSDQFSRFEKVDWEWLRSELSLHIDRARAVADPTFDVTGVNAQTFVTAPRSPDPLTGQ